MSSSIRRLLPKPLRHFLRNAEDGQIMILAVLTMGAIIAFAGLAIDIGYWMHTKTELQADVDALALGGAQMLCGSEDCDDQAYVVARNLKAPNGLTDTDTVSIRTGYRYDTSSPGRDCQGNTISNHSKITVVARRHNPSFFARIVGVQGANIEACATAGKFAFGGSNGIRPFALEDNCVSEISYGQTVAVKYDSSTTRDCDSDNGNYGAVAIDGTGASVYRTTIKFGSDGLVCTDATPGCCPTLTTGCVGVYQLDTEPGNMIGPTQQGVDYLFANTPSDCDTWEEVTTEDGYLVTGCEPWQESYPSGAATRLIIIPIVDGLWDSGGRHTVTIKNFAVLFLDGWCGPSALAPTGGGTSESKQLAPLPPTIVPLNAAASTNTPVPTSTLTSTPTQTGTPTQTPTRTSTPTPSPLMTLVPPTVTATPTRTTTPAPTATPSQHSTGNNADLCGRFIKMTSTLPDAVLNPSGSLTNITVVKLVE